MSAAIHALEKRLRLYEWQLGLVLEGLEVLNRDLAEGQRAWEGA